MTNSIAAPAAPAVDRSALTPEVREYLTGLSELANAWRDRADDLRRAGQGRRQTQAEVAARADASARAQSFIQAHSLATSFLVPGAGDGAFALATLMPKI